MSLELRVQYLKEQLAIFALNFGIICTVCKICVKAIRNLCKSNINYAFSGSSVGSLNVYQSYADNTQEVKLWSLSGNNGNQWLRATIPISSASRFYIILEGIAGSNIYGLVISNKTLIDITSIFFYKN